MAPGDRGPAAADEPVQPGSAATEPVVPEPAEPGASPAAGEASSGFVPRRRAFLGTALGAAIAGGAAAAGYGYRASRPEPVAQRREQAVLTADEIGTLPAVPFHGTYQPGIARLPQRAAAVVSCNVTAGTKAELTDLMRAITSRARFLTAGGTPPPVGITQPPSDSGVLGPTVVPDGLTVTVGVGPTLFDDRFGLAALKPANLTPMLPYPDDDLDPAQTGGDLIMQLSAGHEDVVLHALRDITKNTRGAMQPNWRIEGFTSPARPAGTVPRNMFGFMDGISNPSATSASQMNDLVWVQPGSAGEPGWTAGGSYLVVRLIRMLTEFWDRVDVFEQEQMIGRYRDTGYPLDANGIYATPDYAADPTGDVIPMNAHMRLANPRTPETASSRVTRRSWNYNRGLDAVGDLDIGLLFTCYQQDIKRQFEATQTRLINEPMIDYISPFGGGYFLALPGVRDSNDYFGRALLT